MLPAFECIPLPKVKLFLSTSLISDSAKKLETLRAQLSISPVFT